MNATRLKLIFVKAKNVKAIAFFNDKKNADISMNGHANITVIFASHFLSLSNYSRSLAGLLG